MNMNEPVWFCDPRYSDGWTPKFISGIPKHRAFHLEYSPVKEFDSEGNRLKDKNGNDIFFRFLALPRG